MHIAWITEQRLACCMYAAIFIIYFRLTRLQSGLIPEIRRELEYSGFKCINSN